MSIRKTYWVPTFCGVPDVIYLDYVYPVAFFKTRKSAVEAVKEHGGPGWSVKKITIE